MKKAFHVERTGTETGCVPRTFENLRAWQALEIVCVGRFRKGNLVAE
jgi:hypothetical protein